MVAPLQTSSLASSSSSTLIDQSGRANKKAILAGRSSLRSPLPARPLTALLHICTALGADLKRTKDRAEELEAKLEVAQKLVVNKDKEINDAEFEFRTRQQTNQNEILNLRKEISVMRKQLDQAILLDNQDELDEYLTLLGHPLTHSIGNNDSRNRFSTDSSTGETGDAAKRRSQSPIQTPTNSAAPGLKLDLNPTSAGASSPPLSSPGVPFPMPVKSAAGAARVQQRLDRIDKGLSIGQTDSASHYPPTRALTPTSDIQPFHINPTKPNPAVASSEEGKRKDRREENVYVTEQGVRIESKRSSMLGKLFGTGHKRRESGSRDNVEAKVWI